MNSKYYVDADIIIIGAGISGLVAAYSLLEKEPTLNVLVLEAQNHIGGKIDTEYLCTEEDSEIVPCDIGSEWIGENQTNLLELINKINCDLIPRESQDQERHIIDYQNRIYFLNDSNKFIDFLDRKTYYDIKLFFDTIEKLCGKIKNNCGDVAIFRSSQISLKDFIETNVSNPKARDILNYLIFWNCGFIPADVSALFYLFYCISTRNIKNQLNVNGAREYRVKNGAIDICEKLQSLICTEFVIKNEKVLRISYGKKYLEIGTTKQTYQCNFVIVATSHKYITDIVFEPELPDNKLFSIRQFTNRSIVKFIATYPYPFWKNNGQSGTVHIIDEKNNQILNCMESARRGKGIISGHLVEQEPSCQLRNHKSQILLNLSKYFGEQIREPIDYLEKKWSEGFISGWSVGASNLLEDRRQQTDRIFWAGSETSSFGYGTMEGAVDAGNRVALEVLYECRPALITFEDVTKLTNNLRIPIKKVVQEPKQSRYFYYYIIGATAVVVFILYRLSQRGG